MDGLASPLPAPRQHPVRLTWISEERCSRAATQEEETSGFPEPLTVPVVFPIPSQTRAWGEDAPGTGSCDGRGACFAAAAVRCEPREAASGQRLDSLRPHGRKRHPRRSSDAGRATGRRALITLADRSLDHPEGGPHAGRFRPRQGLRRSATRPRRTTAQRAERPESEQAVDQDPDLVIGPRLYAQHLDGMGVRAGCWDRSAGSSSTRPRLRIGPHAEAGRGHSELAARDCPDGSGQNREAHAS